MPSISQAKLDELSRYRNALHDERGEKALLRAQISQFNAILDKAIRAANGVQLVNETGRGLAGYGSNYSPGMPFSGETCSHSRPTADELAHLEDREKDERIVRLESRLAAVVAVAEFAKEHKS